CARRPVSPTSFVIVSPFDNW
nr:immunoglobulin heavy chain junction region [Macaca mulatta]MOV90118.1 immunoglobulin heavy chain junction region [Macaca mulatta]MOV91909.1 immunoglobulin heavy chain junction region [Macaca mulatta]